MANINFIISLVNGAISVVAPDNLISTQDPTRLNISLQGFSAPTAVKVNLTLPDGSKYTEQHLLFEVDNPNLYYISLTSLLSTVEVGALSTLTIDKITIYNLGVSYSTTEVYPVDVILTSTDASYSVTDIDRLFIIVNKLNKEIYNLRKE